MQGKLCISNTWVSLRRSKLLFGMVWPTFTLLFGTNCPQGDWGASTPFNHLASLKDQDKEIAAGMINNGRWTQSQSLSLLFRGLEHIWNVSLTTATVFLTNFHTFRVHNSSNFCISEIFSSYLEPFPKQLVLPQLPDRVGSDRKPWTFSMLFKFYSSLTVEMSLVCMTKPFMPCGHRAKKNRRPYLKKWWVIAKMYQEKLKMSRAVLAR